MFYPNIFLQNVLWHIIVSRSRFFLFGVWSADWMRFYFVLGCNDCKTEWSCIDILLFWFTISCPYLQFFCLFVYFDSILRCWAKYIALAAPSIIPDALSIQYNAYNQFFNMYPAHENLYAGGLKLFLFRVCCLLFFLFLFF